MSLKLGIQYRTIPVTSNYTCTGFEDCIQVDASGGAVLITLPDSVANMGKGIKVVKVDTTSNLVTVYSSQFINGVSTFVLTYKNDCIEAGAVSGYWAVIGTGFKTVQNSVVGWRNYLINGGFDFWQRGTSVTGSGNTKTFLADRWWSGNNTGGNATISRQSISGVTGSRYCARLQRTAGSTATGLLYYCQDMETVNSILLQGKLVTFSFLARKGADFSGGSFTVYLMMGTGTDQSLNTGYTGSTIIATSAFSLTTSFQRFTVQGVVPANCTQIGIQNQWGGSGTAGASDYVEVTQFMLNEGSVAPFVLAGGDLEGELRKCQRYYEKSYNLDVVPGTADNSGSLGVASPSVTGGGDRLAGPVFKVQKRIAPPSPQVYNSNTGASGAVYEVTTGASKAISGYVGPGTWGIGQVGANGNTLVTTSSYMYHFVADAEL